MLACLGLTALSLTSCGAGSKQDLSRVGIYGGHPVAPGEHPAVVALAFRDGVASDWHVECSGTLVTPDLVLTAGHCLKGPGFDAKTLGTAVGDRLSIYMGPGNEGGLIQTGLAVTRADYHPMLRAHPLGYADYGLVELARPVDGVEPLPLTEDLATELKALRSGEATLVGFGRRDDGGVGVKYEATAVVQSFTSHEALIGGDGKDGCTGDSGGPALTHSVTSDGSERWRQVGIISRGAQLACGEGGQVSLTADGICWLADAAGGRLGAPAACAGAAPLYDDKSLAQVAFLSICRHEAGNATQQETTDAILLGLRLKSCERAAEHLQSATALDLDYLRLRDLSPLAPFTQLTSLSLRGNRLRDVSVLRHFKALRSVRLNANDITDFSPLTAQIDAGLEIFGRRQQLQNFTDTEFLRRCAAGPDATVRAVFWTTQSNDCATANARLLSLTTLNLADRDLADVGALAGLESLARLNLSGNTRLSDVSPLVSLESLIELDLRGTAVTDVTPLTPLTRRGLRIIQ